MKPPTPKNQTNVGASRMFSGKLYFDDGDVIYVKRLILRKDDVAFHAMATWNSNKNEQWEIDTTAARCGTLFKSNETYPKQGTPLGYAVVLTFTTLESIDGGIFVEGTWLVSGQGVLPFSGDLDSMPL